MVIPLLAGILFIQGVVSTIGFVVIIACGIGVFFILNEQVERRSGKVTEVASGKLPKRPAKTVDHAVLEFREDPVHRSCAGHLLHHYGVVAVGISHRNVQDEGGLGCGWPCCLHSSDLLLRTSGVLGEYLVRLRIEGDEVQVIYPFLGRWRNRAFRFARSPRSR